jgi:hypothetical protein
MKPDRGYLADQCQRRLVAEPGAMALAVAAGGRGSERAPTGTPSTATSGAPSQAVGMAAKLKLADADPCRLLAGSKSLGSGLVKARS